MLMKRNALYKMAEWKNSHNRKPLVLKGARQVGKTWLMKEFGKSYYDSFVYFNFDEEEAKYQAKKAEADKAAAEKKAEADAKKAAKEAEKKAAWDALPAEKKAAIEAKRAAKAEKKAAEEAQAAEELAAIRAAYAASKNA